MIIHRYDIYLSIINYSYLVKTYHTTCYINTSGEFDYVESKISYENKMKEEQEVKCQGN